MTSESRRAKTNWMADHVQTEADVGRALALEIDQIVCQRRGLVLLRQTVIAVRIRDSQKVHREHLFDTTH
jgi:hypothetical protein